MTIWVILWILEFPDLLISTKIYKTPGGFSFFSENPIYNWISFLFFYKKKSDFFMVQFLIWSDNFKIFDWKIYFIFFFQLRFFFFFVLYSDLICFCLYLISRDISSWISFNIFIFFNVSSACGKCLGVLNRFGYYLLFA